MASSRKIPCKEAAKKVASKKAALKKRAAKKISKPTALKKVASKTIARKQASKKVAKKNAATGKARVVTLVKMFKVQCLSGHGDLDTLPRKEAHALKASHIAAFPSHDVSITGEQ